MSQAQDGERFRRGRVYVARPDYHLVLERETMHLSRGPRENRHRPSIDALFRSAAYAHGGRVIGVILTGELDDGTAGLWAIEQRHGTAVVQNPNDSESPSMPRSALQYVETEHVVPLGAIAALIQRLSEETWSGSALPPEVELEVEARIAKAGRGLQAAVSR